MKTTVFQATLNCVISDFENDKSPDAVEVFERRLIDTFSSAQTELISENDFEGILQYNAALYLTCFCEVASYDCEQRARELYAALCIQTHGFQVVYDVLNGEHVQQVAKIFRGIAQCYAWHREDKVSFANIVAELRRIKHELSVLVPLAGVSENQLWMMLLSDWVLSQSYDIRPTEVKFFYLTSV